VSLDPHLRLPCPHRVSRARARPRDPFLGLADVLSNASVDHPKDAADGRTPFAS
jgi:hypothetical protein